VGDAHTTQMHRQPRSAKLGKLGADCNELGVKVYRGVECSSKKPS